MIYVDALMEYTKVVPGCPNAKYWCHLATDDSSPEGLEKLHHFADSIGCKRSWFQAHADLPHYDLVPSKRALAVRVGAVALDPGEFARRCSRMLQRGAESVSTEDRLAEIEARNKASTKGPYRWYGYASNQSISLVGARANIVMDFIRWTKRFENWGRGIPAFNVDGILHPAVEMLKLHESHQGGEILDIDHPDAIALRASWEDRDWLIGEVKRLREALLGEYPRAEMAAIKEGMDS